MLLLQKQEVEEEEEVLQLLSITGQELVEAAEPGKAVTLFLRRTLIPQAGGQTAHQEKEVITAIIQTTPTHGVEYSGGAGGNGGTTGGGRGGDGGSCTYNISDFQEEYGETGSYGTARVIGNIEISWGDNT